MAQWLHIAYQNHNIEPGIMLGVRTRNELIPAGEQAFMRASDLIAMEEGFIPIKVAHFGGKGEDENGK